MRTLGLSVSCVEPIKLMKCLPCVRELLLALLRLAFRMEQTILIHGAASPPSEKVGVRVSEPERLPAAGDAAERCAVVIRMLPESNIARVPFLCIGVAHLSRRR